MYYNLVPESMHQDVAKAERDLRLVFPGMRPHTLTREEFTLACVIAIMRRVDSGKDIAESLKRVANAIVEGVDDGSH